MWPNINCIHGKALSAAEQNQVYQGCPTLLCAEVGLCLTRELLGVIHGVTALFCNAFYILLEMHEVDSGCG